MHPAGKFGEVSLLFKIKFAFIPAVCLYRAAKLTACEVMKHTPVFARIYRLSVIKSGEFIGETRLGRHFREDFQYVVIHRFRRVII